MKKAIALTLTLIVAGGLMIYSASRTINLLQATLPPGQKEMAYLALLAFDGGLIAWTLTFMFGASGAWQRGISVLMIFVSLTGVVIGFGADSLLNASTGGLFDASLLGRDFGFSATLATVAIIALNIAAVTMFHVLSPENRRRMQDEEFNDQIEAAALTKSNQAIPQLAATLAAQLTATRMASLEAAYQNRISDEIAQLSAPRAIVINQEPAQASTTPKPSWIEAAKQIFNPSQKSETVTMESSAAIANPPAHQTARPLVIPPSDPGPDYRPPAAAAARAHADELAYQAIRSAARGDSADVVNNLFNKTMDEIDALPPGPIGRNAYAVQRVMDGPSESPDDHTLELLHDSPAMQDHRAQQPAQQAAKQQRQEAIHAKRTSKRTGQTQQPQPLEPWRPEQISDYALLVKMGYSDQQIADQLSKTASAPSAQSAVPKVASRRKKS